MSYTLFTCSIKISINVDWVTLFVSEVCLCEIKNHENWMLNIVESPRVLFSKSTHVTLYNKIKNISGQHVLCSKTSSQFPGKNKY